MLARGGKRPLAALAAAVLATFALAACGGSEDATDETSPPATTPTREAAEPSGSGGGGADSANPKQEKGRGNKAAGGPDPAKVSTPLRVSGGGSGQFRVKGGDNSIQEFGEESDEGELDEAARALHGFFVARATERWAAACSHLSPQLVEQIEQLAARSDALRGKRCASVLEGFTNPLPISVRRETTLVDAASLRQEDDRAFLIYRGAEGTVYAMPMAQADGEWKVGGLAGTPLS